MTAAVDGRPSPLVLVGPTASGKSEVAMAIARLGAPTVEIVSMDSMQVYRGMDIGTAKPTAAERQEVPHHLLDLVDPHEDHSVAQFQGAVAEALAGIAGREHHAVLVGGTGLYVRSVVDALTIPGRWPGVAAELESEPDTAGLHRRLVALDPVSAGRMEPGNRRRIVRALEVSIGSGRPFSTFGPGLEAYPPVAFHLVGLHVPRAILDERIRARFARMLDDGLLAEVRALRERAASTGRPLSRTARQALGYRELLRHLEDGVPLDTCIDEAIRRTRKFARRQEAWFRRDPRIRWIDVPADRNPVAIAEEVLGDWPH